MCAEETQNENVTIITFVVVWTRNDGLCSSHGVDTFETETEAREFMSAEKKQCPSVERIEYLYRGKVSHPYPGFEATLYRAERIGEVLRDPNMRWAGWNE